MASKRKAANQCHHKAAPATHRPAKKAAAPPLAAELTGDVQPPAAKKGGYGDFLLSATEPATYTHVKDMCFGVSRTPRNMV